MGQVDANNSEWCVCIEDAPKRLTGNNAEMDRIQAEINEIKRIQDAMMYAMQEWLKFVRQVKDDNEQL